jgi:hypothetical protein
VIDLAHARCVVRQHFIAAALLGIGAAGFALAMIVKHEQSKELADRPAASGEVGWVTVYAQLSGGPVPLQPERRRDLPRRQDLAFQLTAKGTGPRIVRIEIEDTKTARRTVMDDERIETPAEGESLDYVLTLDDSAPDDLILDVTLEAPHTRGYTSHYPIHLIGASPP